VPSFLPDWGEIVGLLLLWRKEPNGGKSILFCRRSDNVGEAGKWGLPAGSGILKDLLRAPMATSSRSQMAMVSPAGFVLAEALWDIKLPGVSPEDLSFPCATLFTGSSMKVEIFCACEWKEEGVPEVSEEKGSPLTAQFLNIDLFRLLASRGKIAFDMEETLIDIWPRI